MDPQTIVFSIPLYDMQQKESKSLPCDVSTISIDENTKQWTLGSRDRGTYTENASEEIVKITRHRTVSSDQDDSENPAMQCSLCGLRTLERCLLCRWAPYCSTQCYNLHRPIHQYFCVPHYAKYFPRLTGLNVVPVSVAVQRMESAGRSTAPSPIGIPNNEGLESQKMISLNLCNRLTETGLVHRRARIIRSNLREAGGKSACAICGDPCTQFSKDGSGSIQEHLSRQEGDFLEFPEKCSSGDTSFKERDTMPQRLVRFAGMLICTSCVEIQAAEL
ncbi:hypothetical protein EG68_05334 [Paragonimus skrjabini miyazakii]|uniref:MYND-type domain-containing protein n=1 Tax=Paragonimus skrjabini miyazakii TaxID=59628 RepID=A0A8S9Z2R7_9TREM|nr:hypothetical protein EG68_05334 [Paragonimus skrjabini miyazakii]